MDLLRGQYRIASSLLIDVHLPALTDELCFWEPAAGAMTVRRGTDSRWRADPEPDPAPPATVAWLSWHLIWWWTQTGAALDDRAVPGHDEVDWPGSAASTIERLTALHQEWSARLSRLTEGDLDRPLAFPWPEPRAMAHTLGWVSLELMKNTAELGELRHQFAAGGVAHTCSTPRDAIV